MTQCPICSKEKQEEDYSEWEFILVTEEHQKKLNQWRHNYYIKFLSMNHTGAYQDYRGLIILIARKEIK